MVNSVRQVFSAKHIDAVIYAIISFFLLRAYWSTSPSFYAGIMVCLAGFTMWLSGILYLGDAFEAKPQAKKLVQEGIYSKIRHPIYFGGIVYLIGIIISTLNIIVIAWTAIIIPIQIYRAGLEEKKLEKKFGEDYREYKGKTWF